MKTRLNAGEAALMTFSALCIVSLVGELIWPHPVFVHPSATTSDPVPAPSPAARKVSLSDYRVVAERPLFTANRKPYKVPTEPTITAQIVRSPIRDRPPAFLLNAVIRTPEARIALLSVDGKKGLHKITPGESLDGWTLDQVRADAVVLKRNGRSLIVLLHPEAAKADRQIDKKTSSIRTPAPPAKTR